MYLTEQQTIQKQLTKQKTIKNNHIGYKKQKTIKHQKSHLEWGPRRFWKQMSS